MPDFPNTPQQPRSSDKLRDKLSETRENIADMGHLAKEAVTDKLHELKDRASVKYDEGKERLREYQDQLTESVRESPMKSVLIAAGVGLLLGMWVRR